MNINQRQFSLLNEMGISLWQLKNTPCLPEKTQGKPLYVDDSPIEKSRLFSDILKAFELTTSEVDTSKQPLNLGVYSWQFHIEESVVFAKNTFITPTLTVLQSSPALKKQLWQLIHQHTN